MRELSFLANYHLVAPPTTLSYHHYYYRYKGDEEFYGLYGLIKHI